MNIVGIFIKRRKLLSLAILSTFCTLISKTTKSCAIFAILSWSKLGGRRLRTHGWRALELNGLPPLVSQQLSLKVQRKPQSIPYAVRLAIYGIVSAQLPIPHGTPVLLSISLTERNVFVSSPHLELRASFLTTPYAWAESRSRKALLVKAGGSWATSETPHHL